MNLRVQIPGGTNALTPYGLKSPIPFPLCLFPFHELVEARGVFGFLVLDRSNSRKTTSFSGVRNF